MPLNWNSWLNNHWRLWITLVLLDLSTKQLWRGFGLFTANQGISGGLVSDFPGIVSWASFALIIGLWGGFKRPEERIILIGGVANFIDRLIHKAVTDWLFFAPLGLWFNLADLYIILGLTAVIIRVYGNNISRNNLRGFRSLGD